MLSVRKRHKTDTAIQDRQPSSTVCFNVGGKRYEVSRSLLDQHKSSMLARLASDLWMPSSSLSPCTTETEDDISLFIERDGARFAYVLDYMRDGTVTLPWSIPKSMLKQDLEYFNLDYSDETVHHQDPTNELLLCSGAAARLVAAKQVHENIVFASENLKETDQAILKLHHVRFGQEIAMKTYEKYAGGANLRCNSRHDEVVVVDDCEIAFSTLLHHDAKDFVDPVNNALMSYGLECKALSFLPGSSTDSNYLTYHYLKPSEHGGHDFLSGTISVALMRVEVTVCPCTFS